jgi:hypothetical protein
MPNQLVNTVGTYNPDNLIGGDYPLVTEGVLVASGQGILPRGSVLGVITAAGNANLGKYLLSAAAANDGSQNPVCILADHADTTSGDATSEAYITGEFCIDALTFGTGQSATTTTNALRDLNIYLKQSRS